MKYKLMYGQYTANTAAELSRNNMGAVVFSGLNGSKGIWVDGKLIGTAADISVTDLKGMIGTLEQLSNYGQLEQKDLVNAINDVISSVNTLRGDMMDEIARILGGEDLNKTLDTIKEIQDELLKNTTFYVTYNDGSEEYQVPVTRVVDEETGVATYVDENNNVVATEVPGTESEEGIEYEEGYSDLVKNDVIDTIIDSLERVERIENKGLVSDVNTEDEFLNVEKTDETDGELTTKNIKIGVKYGVFKTGVDVLNPDSKSYEDGVATVENVQDYIEERMVWDEFKQDLGQMETDIEGNEEETYNAPSTDFDDNSIVFGN